MVTGSPGLGTVLGAVFAVDRLVGAVVQRLHALHHSGLVAHLPTGLAAGSPLFHHPPVSTAESQRHTTKSSYLDFLLKKGTAGWSAAGRCSACTDGFELQSALTRAGCTLERCSVSVWVWAFCWFHRSCDAPDGCHSSSCIRIWCTVFLQEEKWWVER